MMPMVITVERLTGKDAFGNNTYAAASRRINARPESPTTTMEGTTADAGATQAASPDTVRLIIDYRAPGVNPGDRVNFDGKQYRIVSRETVWDETAPYYQDITCSNNKER